MNQALIKYECYMKFQLDAPTLYNYFWENVINIIYSVYIQIFYRKKM